jgi:hypothetical protein
LTIQDETGRWRPVLTSEGELEYLQDENDAFDEAVQRNAQKFEIQVQHKIYEYQEPG